MRSAANHRLSWRIGAVSISTMALGVVGTGPGFAATGCEDCKAPAEKDARCVVPGSVKVQADVGKMGADVGDLVSDGQQLIGGESCKTIQLDLAGSRSADPERPGGRAPRLGEPHRSSIPKPRKSHPTAIPEPKLDGADLPGGIPSPRGTHFSIPRPERPSARLPTVANPPRVTTVTRADESGSGGTPWVVVIASATAGMIGGANIAMLAARRKKSSTT